MDDRITAALIEANCADKEAFLGALLSRAGGNQKWLNGENIAICGLGGLGSNVATMLIRAGVSRLHIIDFDKVDVSNLNRQNYDICDVGKFKCDAMEAKIRAINPFAEIKVTNFRLDESNLTEILKDDKIICECFDNPENKAMLAENVLSKFDDKFLISAAGMAGIRDANSIKARKMSERFFVCGDFANDAKMGLFAPRVMLVAAMQAHLVLEILKEKNG